MATKRKTKKVVKKTTKPVETTNNIWAWIFILLGAYFLLGNTFHIRFGEVIAISFIVIGIAILWKKKQV